MAKDTTELKANAQGGLLDMLLNQGKIPDINVNLTKDTLIQLGITIVISITIIILINAVVKTILK